jgi:hypothetical protein
VLAVTIPPATFANDVEVAIVPLTPTAPGALGLAYRLLPEGVTFSQPVTLTFTYSADHADSTRPETLRVATRDDRGYWRVAPSTLDAQQRQLSITTTHFSDWSYVAGLQILPSSASVAVSRTRDLHVIGCGEGADPDADNPQRVLLECVEEEVPPLANHWSVNGIPGGDSSVGTIAGATNATYSAPGAVPPQNPVAVSARVQLPTGLTTLVSNIKVVDEVAVYEGTINGHISWRVDDQEQFFELSADVRFVLRPDLSGPDSKWYEGSGTARVHGRPFGCAAGSSTGALVESTLQIGTAGAQAGTYVIVVGATPSVTLDCGDPPAALTTQLLGVAGGGGNIVCPTLRFDDIANLVGSWTCNDGAMSARSNWTLRAIE